MPSTHLIADGALEKTVVDVSVPALWATCFDGHLDITRFRVALRPSLIRVVDGDGRSLFGLACPNKHIDVAQCLYEADSVWKRQRIHPKRIHTRKQNILEHTF